jgi:hypothetical protein
MPAAGSDLCAGADWWIADSASSPLAASGHYARRWFAAFFDRSASTASTTTVPSLMVT